MPLRFHGTADLVEGPGTLDLDSNPQATHKTTYWSSLLSQSVGNLVFSSGHRPFQLPQIPASALSSPPHLTRALASLPTDKRPS